MITIVSLLVVVSQHPVKSAVFLVVDLFLLAGLYASMDSHFIAAIQILVYAGAIVVLFLFVIMLLNLKADSIKGLRFSAPEAAALLISFIGFLIMTFNVFRGQAPEGIKGGFSIEAIDANGGNTYMVAMRLLTTYIWPFELASMLILLAIVAAIVIAKKDKILKSLIQKELR
ncbi:MAG: NADH-quinone oxidoreductase subunit J [Proteobacteria bacterium]|nr:NADH-quinone oxidoreductase subunit J [Pseudomonadota bacterium]